MNLLIRMVSTILSSASLQEIEIDDGRDFHHQKVWYITNLDCSAFSGGGGYDIHYGIYRDDSYTVKEASQATTDFMLDMLDWNRPINEGSKVCIVFL